MGKETDPGTPKKRRTSSLTEHGLTGRATKTRSSAKSRCALANRFHRTSIGLLRYSTARHILQQEEPPIAGAGGDAEEVGWAPHSQPAPIQDIGVQQGRRDVPVTEQLLDGPEVIATTRHLRLTHGGWVAELVEAEIPGHIGLLGAP